MMVEEGCDGLILRRGAVDRSLGGGVYISYVWKWGKYGDGMS